MDGTKERRILQPSPDVIELSDDEPEIVEEIKTKEPARSEKIAETRKEESKGVAEVPIADKEEETAMDTEAPPLVGAPEVAASAPE